MRRMKRPLTTQDNPLQSHTRVNAICRYIRQSYRQARNAEFDTERAADYAIYRLHRMNEDDMFWMSVHPDGRKRVNGAYRTRD